MEQTVLLGARRVGLVLGGWRTGLDAPLGIAGWRYTFLIVAPIGLGAAFFTPRVFEESRRHAGQLDVPNRTVAVAVMMVAPAAMFFFLSLQARADELAPGVAKAATRAGLDQAMPPGDFPAMVAPLSGLGASALVWLFLDVGHTEPAPDEAPEAVHLG